MNGRKDYTEETHESIHTVSLVWIDEENDTKKKDFGFGFGLACSMLSFLLLLLYTLFIQRDFASSSSSWTFAQAAMFPLSMNT